MNSNINDISPEEREKAVAITSDVLGGFEPLRTQLVPILHAIQRQLGYIPIVSMKMVASFISIPEVDVYEVVTFYNHFRLNPPGNHSIRVCLGTACHMKGGYITLDAWERRLGIKSGQTTSDREFDLDTVACVGCCTMAPVTVIDDKPEAKVEPTKVDGILMAFDREKESGKDKK